MGSADERQATKGKVNHSGTESRRDFDWDAAIIVLNARLELRREALTRQRVAQFRSAPAVVQREFWSALRREIDEERASLQRLYELHGIRGEWRTTTVLQWDARWAAKARRQRAREEGRLDDSFENGRDLLLAIAPAEYFSRLCNREPGRDHKVSCPIHDERTRSCHLYPTAERGWKCFGCGAGGDIYSLACALWDLPRSGRGFMDAHRRLMELFG